MKRKLFNTFKTLAVALLLVISIGTFVACSSNDDKKQVLWKADFSTADNGVFSVYSDGATHNSNGTMTLSPIGDGAGAYSASTYFGETDKNFDWKEGGMEVHLSVKVDSTVLTEGKHAVWSLALNELDGKYLTELPVYFVGTADGVKFKHEFTGVETDYQALVAEDAATITTGDYTAIYDFDVNDDKELVVAVKLTNASGVVYASDASTFTVIEPTLHEGKDYTNDTVVAESMVKGLRYLWFVRSNTTMTVAGLEVIK